MPQCVMTLSHAANFTYVTSRLLTSSKSNVHQVCQKECCWLRFGMQCHQCEWGWSGCVLHVLIWLVQCKRQCQGCGLMYDFLPVELVCNGHVKAAATGEVSIFPSQAIFDTSFIYLIDALLFDGEWLCTAFKLAWELTWDRISWHTDYNRAHAHSWAGSIPTSPS